MLQSTLPSEERLIIPSLARETCASIHAPAGGAATPHPSTWRRIQTSIHAPAWGATGCSARAGRGEESSIHAPGWGATQFKGFMFFYDCLQSTLSPGERTKLRTKHLVSPLKSALPGGERLISQISRYCIGASIHAPAWGSDFVRLFWPQ